MLKIKAQVIPKLAPNSFDRRPCLNIRILFVHNRFVYTVAQSCSNAAGSRWNWHECCWRMRGESTNTPDTFTSPARSHVARAQGDNLKFSNTDHLDRYCHLVHCRTLYCRSSGTLAHIPHGTRVGWTCRPKFAVYICFSEQWPFLRGFPRKD